ncbi:MAG: nucleoside-diphosphate sugar epimerase [Gammaproteobacteria bacterium]|nr:nucleoside-diphosphate sugar epimerase [Gammaproteobacteria bacterium]
MRSPEPGNPDTTHGQPQPRRVVVWRFTDGKPGHEKQSLGLLQALAERVALETHRFDVRFTHLFWRQLRGHALHGYIEIPVPDLIVGVGHRTHLYMLLTRFVCGGRVVALMKPSLPHRWFDLVFVPRHDRYLRKGNLVETRGVVCPATRGDKRAGRGLILVGGRNRHFEWDPGEIATQVTGIARSSPETHWSVCDSPRTPAAFRAALPEAPNLAFRHWRTTASDFLEGALAEAAYVWVTADSVSMLYEALSAQATVGVIALKKRRPHRGNKLSRGIALLRAQGHVYLSSDGYRLRDALPPPHFFSESRRCADIVVRRMLSPPPAVPRTP